MVAETQPPSIADFLISEQLLNEELDRAILREQNPSVPVNEHEVQRTRVSLIENLTKQAPNSVACDARGNISRALVFSGQYPFEAYWELIDISGEERRRVRSQWFVGIDQASIKQEINWVNRQNGMNRDLLTQPDQILRVQKPVTGEITFAHIVNSGTEPLVVFRYHMTSYGAPYCIGIEKGAESKIEGHISVVPRPLQALVDYANRPFAKISS